MYRSGSRTIHSYPKTLRNRSPTAAAILANCTNVPRRRSAGLVLASSVKLSSLPQRPTKCLGSGMYAGDLMRARQASSGQAAGISSAGPMERFPGGLPTMVDAYLPMVIG